MAYPEYFLKVHQPDLTFPAVCRCPGRYSTGECMVPVASRSRRSGVPASAGSDVPGRLSLSRQAFHRRMHGACCIPISPLRSPGFSRIRRSRQAFHRLKPGLPDGISGVFSQSSSAGSGVPGRLSLSRQAFHRRMHGACCIPISPLRSPGFSRIRRSRPSIAVPAGIPPANAWCLLHPDLAAQESRLQPDQTFPTVYRCPGRHSTGECMVPVASRSRRSGVPASAGPDVPNRISLSRQAFHRRMHGACCIPISPLRSPGFSRI